MEVAAVIQRVEYIAATCSDADVDADGATAALVAVREITAWADARHADLASKLRATSSFPESAIASSSKLSLGAASKLCDRATTLDATPALAGALGDGAITAGHVDAVTRGSRQLDPSQREELFGRIESLIDVAAAATVDQFSSRVAMEVKRIQAADGVDRLERQRRNTRLTQWVDGEGMWNLRGRFDPLTGVAISSRLDATVEALFSQAVPDLCPSDPIEKQQFLAAHALRGLVEGEGKSARSGRADFVVVVDADATGVEGPVATWPIPVEVPARILAELAGDADTSAVVVRNGVVLYAPGELNLGRSTRLANRAQRRALRGLYRGCSIPGCNVAYERCKLHHVVWWRDGGRTDLDNLVPICSVHHGKVHHDGWVIELGERRELTLRLPDGSVQATGPPGRRAA